MFRAFWNFPLFLSQSHTMAAGTAVSLAQPSISHHLTQVTTWSVECFTAVFSLLFTLLPYYIKDNRRKCSQWWHVPINPLLPGPQLTWQQIKTPNETRLNRCSDRTPDTEALLFGSTQPGVRNELRRIWLCLWEQARSDQEIPAN